MKRHDSTRMGWTSLDGRIDSAAAFDRSLPKARLSVHASGAHAADDSTHHVAVVRTRWRTRLYLDGKRVRRWHPYLRALRRRRAAREVLGL